MMRSESGAQLEPAEYSSTADIASVHTTRVFGSGMLLGAASGAKRLKDKKKQEQYHE